MSNAYYNMNVVDITQETSDAITLHLDHPDKATISYIPGQFLTLILPIEGKKVRRSYSLCSIPEDPYFSVTVKRVEGGLMSNYLADHVQVGQTIEVMAPLGNFVLKPDASVKRHLFLFGGGSGITPLMSMLKSTLTYEPQSRVTLIYGNRNLDSVIFKEQLTQLEQQYPQQLKIVHVFNESISDATEPQEHIGLLDRTMVLRLLENLREPGYQQEGFYICGPEAMMNEVREALHFMNIPANQIHKESFTAPTTTEDHGADVSAALESDQIITRTVTILFEGQEYQVEVKPSETILEAGLKADIDLPYSCQAGLCTACMERTNMIGALKAMGATNRQIRGIFLHRGLRLTISGLLGGNLLALVFCAMQDYFKLIPLDPENYYMDTVPIFWDWRIWVGINGITFLLTMLSILLPTLLIARIHPVKAIKFD